MSIISKIKTFFTKTAGTPVPAPENLKPQEFAEIVQDAAAIAKPIAPKPEKIKRSTLIWTLVRFIRPISKLIGRLFRYAILLTALAHFVPELRETDLSYFYNFVDLLIDLLQWLSMMAWQLVQIVF